MKKTEIQLKSEFKTKSEEHFQINLDDNNIGCVKILFDGKNYWLNKIELQTDYIKTKKKYGTKTISLLVKEYPSLKISLSSRISHNTSVIKDDSRYLSTGGFNLMKSCFRDGILLESNFDLPYDICELYKDFNFLDNPVYKFMNQLNYKLNKAKSISFKGK